MEFIEISAKSVEAALEQAKTQGYIVESHVIMQKAKSGFLGFGRKPAVVRIYYKEDNQNLVQRPIDTDSLMDVKPVENQGTEPVSHYRQEQMLIAQKGFEFLSDMFSKMGMSVSITMNTSAKTITYQISGQDEIGLLIGKHGQTLDAIQYLTTLVATKDHHTPNRYRILVDVEGYRNRRAETLRVLAKRMAEKAKYDHQKVRLEPMSAIERKVIHMALAKEKGIITDSEGQEPFRYVTISYKP